MFLETAKLYFAPVREYLLSRVKKVTADALAWLASVTLHCSTIPTLLAILAGLTDKPMPTDIILFVYAALVLLFCTAIITRNIVNMITICLGFVAQSVLMSLILFK
jgi:hypothetical protein